MKNYGADIALQMRMMIGLSMVITATIVMALLEQLCQLTNESVTTTKNQKKSITLQLTIILK